MPVETPAWGPKDKHRLLNTKLPRVDAPLKSTGTAQYTYDVKVPGMLFGRILRCPYPRARVTSIDLTPALKVAGVAAAVLRPAAPQVDPEHYEVRFEGDPVAAVAATTSDQADDGIHAIDVKYEVLPFAINAEQAMAPGAPAVFPNDPRVTNNVRAAAKRGDPDKADAALKTSDVVVEAEYRTRTLHHACLESHGVVVDYQGGDKATVYCSTQSCFSISPDAARQLGLDESAVTGVVQYMGGGFGAKGSGIGIEGDLACALSKAAKAPVKLMVNRKEEFVMTGNGGYTIQKFRAGASKDGKATAMHVTQHAMGGVGRGSVAAQPYIYHFPVVYSEAVTVHTNVDSQRPLRAPGNPPACFAMESLMDELAEKIGMDPLEFRIKNLTDEAWIRQLRRGAQEIGWERRNSVAGGSPGTLKRGFGCGVGQWGGGGRGGNQVAVAITRDGKVTASIGTQDLGTGTRTYIVAIVAEELGLEMEDVTAEIGTTLLGNASGSGGSSTAPSVAPVVKSAAVNAKAEIAKYVAPLLGGKPEDVVFDNRSVSAGGKSLTWQQACAAIPAGGINVQGEFIAALASNRTHGAAFAEVEVDTETGHVQPIRMVSVQDCGLPLNRLAVESQINGGMVQGVGMALYEGAVIDPTLGFMLNSSFMDYKIPGCKEMPEIVPIIDDGDTRNAVVGVGEPPSIPPAAAIANAVYNACGVRVRDLPITPDKILMGLMKNA